MVKPVPTRVFSTSSAVNFDCFRNMKEAGQIFNGFYLNIQLKSASRLEITTQMIESELKITFYIIQFWRRQ